MCVKYVWRKTKLFLNKRILCLQIQQPYSNAFTKKRMYSKCGIGTQATNWKISNCLHTSSTKEQSEGPSWDPVGISSTPSQRQDYCWSLLFVSERQRTESLEKVVINVDTRYAQNIHLQFVCIVSRELLQLSNDLFIIWRQQLPVWITVFFFIL